MTEPAKKGRPSKLTPEVEQKICDAIRRGAYRESAADHAGIDRSTIWLWMQRGEDEDEGPYRHFFDAVRKAESDLELEEIEGWRKDGAGNWQARAEFLGRRFRDRWAKQENLKVDATVKVTGARESLLAKLEEMAKSDKEDAVDPGLAVEADDLPGNDVSAPGRAGELAEPTDERSSLEDED